MNAGGVSPGQKSHTHHPPPPLERTGHIKQLNVELLGAVFETGACAIFLDVFLRVDGSKRSDLF